MNQDEHTGAKIHFKSGKSIIVKRFDIKAFFDLLAKTMNKIEEFPLIEIDGNIVNIFEIEFIEKWHL